MVKSEIHQLESTVQSSSSSNIVHGTMDRLRRSFRDSFRRRKKDRVPESSKPHQWQADEAAVRGGDCSFPVKYLGCVEVFDSRGMNICEEALKLLRNSRRRPVKGVLYVTGDGLRVVDDETKGLIVDQTIEKVSFCAPDRNYEKGFSYICRDGTTRRWMCHGFQAKHDSGERLSHAVGCAFAVCLERKQKRDKEVAVTMNFDKKSSTFTRNGSFRQSTITERLKDPQFVKPAEPVPVKQVYNPFAIERPHATVQTLERQGSFRGFSSLSSASPFKRQLSLRISDLPSNLARHQVSSRPMNGNSFNTNNGSIQNGGTNGFSRPSSNGHGHKAKDEEEVSKVEDTISEMCKELSFGLQLMTNNDSPFTPAIPTSPSSSFDGGQQLTNSSIPIGSRNGQTSDVQQQRSTLFSPNLSASSSNSSSFSSPTHDGTNWISNNPVSGFINKSRLAPTPSSSFDTFFNDSNVVSSFLVNQQQQQQPTTSVSNANASSNGNNKSNSSWVSLESPFKRPAAAAPITSQVTNVIINGSTGNHVNKTTTDPIVSNTTSTFGSIKRVTKTTLPVNPVAVPPRNNTTTKVIVRDPFDAEWAALSTPTIPLPTLAPTITTTNGHEFNNQDNDNNFNDVISSNQVDNDDLITNKSTTLTNNRINSETTSTNPFLTTSSSSTTNNISKAFEVQM